MGPIVETQSNPGSWTRQPAKIYSKKSMQPNRILTPDQLRRTPIIGGGGPPEPPSPDEIMTHFEASLDVALGRDMGAQASVVTYAALRSALAAAGMEKEAITAVLPNIKIAVSDTFVKHAKFQSIMDKFARVIVNLYNALKVNFGSDALPLLTNMAGERFSLVMPL